MAADIGFIGIGNMGFHMAGNVRKKMDRSSILHIFDVNSVACQNFVDRFGDFGPVRVANSSKEVADACKTVLSMVPMDQHCRAVYLDSETGVIAARADQDRLVLECSTISISTAQEVGKAVMEAGRGSYIDTPVSGGVGGAEAGSLSFFIGYPNAATDNDPLVQHIKTVIGWMGAAERINFCGFLGGGLVSKIANNYMGLCNLAAATQGMAFGIRHGMDPEALYKCIKGSSGDSWILNFSPPVPGVVAKSASSNGFRAGFRPSLCVKDISLAINAAQEVGINATMGEMALKEYERADQDPRTTGLDCSSIWLLINDQVDTFSESK